MTDISNMKLGRLPAKPSYHRFQMASQIFKKLPKAPPSFDYTDNIKSWGMMANDRYGDCVFAGIGHFIQVATEQTDKEVTVSDATVLGYYTTWAGFNASDPNTDQGAVEADVLNQWKRSDFAGYKLLGYSDPDALNHEHVRQAIAFFGPLYIGANLPVNAQWQDVWDLAANDGGDWGGHCMIVPQYDAKGLTFITWGGLKRCTWDWWDKYIEETHALLVDVWMKKFPAASVDVVKGILGIVDRV
jgi:hypothetical protein